jgi:hypothetical protein
MCARTYTPTRNAIGLSAPVQPEFSCRDWRAKSVAFHPPPSRGRQKAAAHTRAEQREEMAARPRELPCPARSLPASREGIGGGSGSENLATAARLCGSGVSGYWVIT